MRSACPSPSRLSRRAIQRPSTGSLWIDVRTSWPLHLTVRGRATLIDTSRMGRSLTCGRMRYAMLACGRTCAMRAGRRDVPLTHPDKVLFPDDGITKADLAAYYRDAAPRMVDLVRDRPVSLQRFNAGIARPGFFQKNVERGAPEWVKRVQVGKRGGTLWHVLANDAATLVWLANQ